MEWITLETILNTKDLRDKHREYGIGVVALEILEGLSRAIQEAGGAHDAQCVANLRVGDLAILCARNSISLQAVYTKGLDKLLSKPLKQVKTEVASTNGYCDTCGDMYTRGYESQHPNCRRWPVDNPCMEI